jgi:hypothetical protein
VLLNAQFAGTAAVARISKISCNRQFWHGGSCNADTVCSQMYGTLRGIVNHQLYTIYCGVFRIGINGTKGTFANHIFWHSLLDCYCQLLDQCVDVLFCDPARAAIR